MPVARANGRWGADQRSTSQGRICEDRRNLGLMSNENHNINKADVLLFLCDPLPWLDWRHLNVYIRVTALTGGI